MIAPGGTVVHSEQALVRNSKMIYHDFDNGSSMLVSTVVAPIHCTILHNYLASEAVRSLAPHKPPTQALYQSKSLVHIARQGGHTVEYPDSTPDDGEILPTSYLLPEICLSNAPAASFDALYEDMATTTVSVPGSPPDLSGSRSSKSSSYCSTSQFSGAEGVLSDVSHFEEIGLDDEKQSGRSTPNDGGRSSIQPPNVVTPRSTLTRTPTSPLRSTQNLPTITTTPHTPDNRQTKQPSSVQSREMHIRPSLQHGSGGRGFTSSSVTTLPMALESIQPRTRSSSPINRSVTAMNTAVNMGSRLRPNPHSSRSSLPLHPRMGSWNPRRKSVQELEAEYHDSDDDLPDETSLWNIPVSPRPPEERISPISSSRGSPERYGDSRSPRTNTTCTC